MPTPQGVRCPVCGHLTPLPRSREFLTCTCGLRLACGPPPAAGLAREQTLFAWLTILCMLTAAVDLVRRLR